MAQLVKNLSATWETWVRSLGWEDPLEKGKVAHSSILAWRIPRIVQSMGSQRVGHNWATFTFTCSIFSASYISIQFLQIKGSSATYKEKKGSPSEDRTLFTVASAEMMTPLMGCDDSLPEAATFTPHLPPEHRPPWIILIGSSEACVLSAQPPSLDWWGPQVITGVKRLVLEQTQSQQS